MEVQVVECIPEMSVGELEKVLKYLPEPTQVEVALCGSFDYSDIIHQAEELIKGIKLRSPGRLKTILESGSKESILEIYKSSYELKKAEPTKETKIPRRIDLSEVRWYLDNGTQIKLTPLEVNVSHKGGQEPACIFQMRQELVGTNIRMNIKVNQQSSFY